MCFNPKNTLIASGSKDKTVGVFDINGKTQAILKGHKSDVTHVCFTPTGQELLSGSRDGLIIIWNAIKFSQKRQI